MSSALVRNIPLIVEGPNGKKCYAEPMAVNESGFSFDKDFERDREHHPFRSQLDDLAQRHPEFAEHLNFGNTFPFRSNLRERDRGRWGSQERPSGSQDPPTGSQDPFEEYRRFTDRPFGPRFERFPFQRRFPDEPGFERHSQSPQPQPQQQQQQAPQQPQSAPVHNPPEETRPEPPQTEKKPVNPNLVQSNTVDLGQKQEPVDDKRNQRSMSAPPPDNRGGQQRFVSTFNIPVQKENAGGGECPPQNDQKQHQSRMTERVIPIHVEGRDEPVIPRNANHAFAQPPPQPERIFGHKPSHFTQFVNRPETQQHFPSAPEQTFRQHNFPQQQQQKQATPPPAQEKPQEKQPQSGKLTPSDQIQAIQKDVLELMDQVEKFTGKYRDKQYLYLDEMLTRNLIKLDNIETEGKDAVRQARKEAIKCVQKCINILEAKAAANDPEGAKAAEREKMEVEAAEENPQENPAENTESTAMETEPIQQLEVSGVVKSGTTANVPETTQQEVAMEVAAAESKPETENNKTEEVKEPESEAKNPEVNTETRAVLVQDTKAEDAQTEDKKEEKSKEKKKGKKKEKVEKK